MANISISLHLNAYKGFKFLVEKDQAGNKIYYAAVPVKELFNPSGTTNIYATSVMIPTPNSQYSDFMLKPMLSAKELQTMTKEQFQALPVLGTGKYMEKQVGKDLMKEAAKSATVDEEEMSEVFGMPAPQAADPVVPAMPSAPTPMPWTMPDTSMSLYYICDNNQIIAQAKIWADACQMFKAQQSPTTILYKYEGNAVVGTWTKDILKQLGA